MARKYLIVAAQFNEIVTKSLVEGAISELVMAGVSPEDTDLVWVPGAFELPTVAAKGARSRKYKAVICIGCVIRGETPHFDYVAGQAASGVMKVSVETEIPIIFGVLTTDTVDQAMNRAGIKYGNKGRDAARAALQMTRVMAELGEGAV